MKTPQNIAEFGTCLHTLVDAGVFLHFGEPDEVHDLVEDLLDLLEDIEDGVVAAPTFIESFVLQTFFLTLESFLEPEDGTESL